MATRHPDEPSRSSATWVISSGAGAVTTSDADCQKSNNIKAMMPTAANLPKLRLPRPLNPQVVEIRATVSSTSRNPEKVMNRKGQNRWLRGSALYRPLTKVELMVNVTTPTISMARMTPSRCFQ